jgi:SAM-dependent methyltransferase
MKRPRGNCARTRAMPEEYLHGTTPAEQGRLSLLNRLMNDNALREIAVERGDRIVDFGSGLGQLSRGMARAAGLRLLGIERSAQQLAECARQAALDGEEHLLELRQGDATEPPLRDDEWGHFDLAHARFVLEHVANPLLVVQQMARAVRPGGRVVLQDDDHDTLRLWPEPAGFDLLWRSYIRTYDRIGCDPYVGRKLVSLFHQAGLKPRRCTYLFFGACSAEGSWDGFIDNLIGLFTGSRAAVCALIRPDEFDCAVKAIREWAARPDAAFWYAVSYAEGVKP